MAFRWRADNGLMNAGLVGRTSIPMDSYSFVILRGRGGSGPPSPQPLSGSAHVLYNFNMV